MWISSISLCSHPTPKRSNENTGQYHLAYSIFRFHYSILDIYNRWNTCPDGSWISDWTWSYSAFQISTDPVYDVHDQQTRIRHPSKYTLEDIWNICSYYLFPLWLNPGHCNDMSNCWLVFFHCWNTSSHSAG